MSDKIKVQYATARHGNKVGDVVELDAARAKQLIRSGVVAPATVPDAKAAGVEPDAAATKRS